MPRFHILALLVVLLYGLTSLATEIECTQGKKGKEAKLRLVLNQEKTTMETQIVSGNYSVFLKLDPISNINPKFDIYTSSDLERSQASYGSVQIFFLPKSLKPIFRGRFEDRDYDDDYQDTPYHFSDAGPGDNGYVLRKGRAFRNLNCVVRVP